MLVALQLLKAHCLEEANAYILPEKRNAAEVAGYQVDHEIGGYYCQGPKDSRSLSPA